MLNFADPLTESLKLHELETEPRAGRDIRVEKLYFSY